jgi:HSP20 family protein
MIKIEKTRGLRPFFHDWAENFFGRDDDLLPSFGLFNKTNPAVNILETPKMFFVELAVPGMKKDDFHVTVENTVLVIKAELEEEKEVKDTLWTRREWNYTQFNRSFMLPENVLIDKIEANYENGILKVMLPKVKVEEKKLKEITIKS